MRFPLLVFTLSSRAEAALRSGSRRKWRYRSAGHSTLEAAASLAGESRYAGPGGWPDGDFLKTGGEACAGAPGKCPQQTEAEYRTESAFCKPLRAGVRRSPAVACTTCSSEVLGQVCSD